MSKRRVLALIVLVIVLVCLALLAADEIRLRRPTRGMPIDQVRASLGAPSKIIDRAEIDQYPAACRKDAVVQAYLYQRRFRESLYLYVDSAGRVECTERAMAFSIVTP